VDVKQVDRDVMACGIVLGAGSGSRMGTPKAVLELDGVRLIDRAVAVLRAGGCADVVAVVRSGISVEGARAVVNAAPERGMGSSLQLGLGAASGEVAVVLLVDTPGILPASVRAVAAAAAPASIATYAGVRGPPVALAREIWAEVAAASSGDRGAGPWLRAHPELVHEVPCDGDASDLDTPADLARWRGDHGRLS
jgi:CTP:molybdopterin cytidylyltransferase MocA